MAQKIFIIIILLSNPIFSQNEWFHYDWNSESPADFANLCSDLYKYDLKKYNDNLFVGKFYERFTEECVAEVNNDLLNGNFYQTFGGYDGYLKKILNTIVPDTNVTNNIKIIIYRDNDWNAEMNESGVIRLYLGCLSNLNNEAELAMILGHEYAHLLNQDVAKTYGREIGTIPNAINVVAFLDNADWFKRSRELEADADFISINLLKASPYSIKSGAMVFKHMKRLEIRNQIKYGKEFNLFTSHPDPGNRLKQVRLLSNDSLNIGRKNFVVDSLSFVKLKELSFEESINQGLEQNEIDQMIDLTFTRYLFEPNNQDNLAVLIECLRRTLILGKKKRIGKKSFILNQYQTSNIKKLKHLFKDWNSPFNIAKNYPFLKEKKPSILKYLTKGFIDITKEDLIKIKAEELLDTAKIEFATYREAYNYFIQKASDMNCEVCTLYKYFGDKIKTDELKSYISHNNLFEINDLLNARISGLPEYEKDMFVILPSEVMSPVLLDNKSVKDKIDFNKQITEAIDVKLGKKTVKLYDLPYKDQHLISACMSLCLSKSRPKRNNLIRRSKINWLETYPELYSFFKRNEVRNLYICESGLQQNRRTQVEYYSFYKIGVPGKSRKTLRYKMMIRRKSLQKDRVFISNVANKFALFYYGTN
jgi:hypothetical protein